MTGPLTYALSPYAGEGPKKNAGAASGLAGGLW